jgi:SAM-dependent methyltransferase
MKADQQTADAFASSWNNLPSGSIYTHDQVVDWFQPLSANDIRGERVLEMGCGNGSLMVHVLRWSPKWLDRLDLGAAVVSAEANLTASGYTNWSLRQDDLTTFTSDGYDIVYSIGVLLRLKDPRLGFESVVRNARHGGRFHCWVRRRGKCGRHTARRPDKARRGAPTLVAHQVRAGNTARTPVFRLGQALGGTSPLAAPARWPLYEYSLWIAKREFAFFRHVAFDQLVTPQTIYLDRATIVDWLKGNERIVRESTYVVMRNGNSWKFGGRIR